MPVNDVASRADAPSAKHPAADAVWWQRAPVTALIALVNVVVFAVAFGLALAWPRIGPTLEQWLWNTPRLVTDRLWLWQLVTANFVHHGPVHLAVNMFFVVWLGPQLERQLGSRRFAFFYVGAGVFAYAVYDLSAGVFSAWGTTAGASGCVLAVATLYTLCFPRRIVALYGVFHVRFRWIVFLFIISDLSSLLWPGGLPWVNNVVHLGGVVFAVGYWYLFARTGNIE